MDNNIPNKYGRGEGFVCPDGLRKGVKKNLRREPSNLNPPPPKITKPDINLLKTATMAKTPSRL